MAQSGKPEAISLMGKPLCPTPPSDQIEPDGQPNARNTPTSTLNSNTY